ncbi:MAG: hypothetical protein ACRD3N_00765 [Terracidiphilus sp.]
MICNVPSLALRRFSFLRFLGAALLVSSTLALAAQQPPASGTEAQHAAMAKLAFLAGRWSGPVTIVRGPGEPLHLTQSEDVQYKLDGLVLLIEGESRAADGKVLFSALATVSYDDASHAYRFRAYHDGHYLDTELSVRGKGFSWGFTAGPAHIVNTMHLTDTGEWSETTEVKFGDHPPVRSVDMLLKHQS